MHICTWPKFSSLQLTGKKTNLFFFNFQTNEKVFSASYLLIFFIGKIVLFISTVPNKIFRKPYILKENREDVTPPHSTSPFYVYISISFINILARRTQSVHIYYQSIVV